MNPNYDIFHIPTLAGADEDDQFNGSIGDAMAQHVHSLSGGDRQMWEEMIHTSDGNLFRVIPSLDSADKDEEDEEEKQRREESEDVLDQCELVPYAEWEKFPQMWNTIDIPKTPKDKFMYCGNTKQVYYDVFPEGHPNVLAINSILSQVRAKNPYEIDEGYRKWIVNNIYSLKLGGKMYAYVADHLKHMVESVYDSPSYREEYIIAALKCIDGEWATEFRETVKSRFINEPMYRLMVTQEAKWEERYKLGESVYTDVKTFGQLLFTDPMLRQQMTSNLWNMYRKMKRKFSPKVLVCGYDVNRCSLRDLQKIFKCDDKTARNIWHNRPYESLADMYGSNVITKKHFGGTKDTDKVIDWIETTAESCKVRKNASAMNVVSQKMTTAQAANNIKFTDDEWRMMWAYLRICKQDIMEQINGKGE